MAEPVLIELARAQCSIGAGDTSFDTLLNAYIVAARLWVENHTGKILDQREVTDELRGFCSFLDLRWGPVSNAAVSIDYIDSEGADQAITDAVLNGSRLYPADAWPTIKANTGLSVTYTAGYDAGEVPQPLIQAMLLLVGHWFLNREAANDQSISEVPLAVKALTDPYRAIFL